MLEKEIERRLVKLVGERGGLAYKFVSPANPGAPDRIIITPAGVVWFVELKTEHGSSRKIQKWQAQQLVSVGANFRELKGWEAAKNFVEEIMPYDIHATPVPKILR